MTRENIADVDIYASENFTFKENVNDKTIWPGIVMYKKLCLQVKLIVFIFHDGL